MGRKQHNANRNPDAPQPWRKFTAYSRNRTLALKAPPGFDHNTNTTVAQKLPAKELAARKLKMQDMQCMAIARKPINSLPMSAFMNWMTGTRVNIFVIMQLFMQLNNGFTAIFGVSNVFKQIGHPRPLK